MSESDPTDQIIDQCKSLWKSGEIQALQIHFCAGGTSSLWHLIYPAGALDELKSPAGRARWMMGVEEAFEDTRFEISSLPTGKPGEPQWAACSVSGWAGGDKWRARRMSFTGMKELIGELDRLAGAPSARARGGSFLMFGEIGEAAKSALEGSEKRGGARLEQAVGEALARRERAALEQAAGLGEPRPGPKL